MFTTYLSALGVALIAFYPVVVRAIPYTLLAVPDTRIAPQFVSVWLACIIGIVSLLFGEIKKLSNKWIGILLIYLFVNISLGFKTPLLMNDIDITQFWVWKPLAFIFSYFLMFMAVSSAQIDKDDVEFLLKTILGVGIVMGMYVAYQYFGFDQFFSLKNNAETPFVTSVNLVGTLGQPTIVAPIFMIVLPLTIYFRRPVYFIFVCIVLAIIKSWMALLSSGVALVAYLWLLFPKLRNVMLLLIIFVSLLTIFNFDKSLCSGRIGVWRSIIHDIKTSHVGDDSDLRYSVSGSGIGSFGVLYHQKYNNAWHQAHNEYLQMWYSIGIVGLGLFFISLINSLKFAYKTLKTNFNIRSTMIVILSSFIGICFCSAGTFIWQIAIYQFISVILFGLINNENLRRA